MDLNWRLLIIEEVEALTGSAGFRVFENNTGPYIVSVGDDLMTGEQVQKLADVLRGIDLEPTFTVHSARSYNRVQFRWFERKQPDHKMPPPSDKSSLDRGTSPNSPIHHKYDDYRKDHHE